MAHQRRPKTCCFQYLQHISKYASKAEPQSTVFSEIYSQILNNSNANDPHLILIFYFRKTLQKWFFRRVWSRNPDTQNPDRSKSRQIKIPTGTKSRQVKIPTGMKF